MPDDELTPPAPPPVPSEPDVIDITADVLAPEKPRETRVDFERGMSYFATLSIALIVVNAIIFAWELSVGALNGRQDIIAAGALYRPLVMEGQLWRLVTAMFLHGGPGHLLGNCLMLYILGLACEHAIGLKQTAIVYLVSGLCGSVLSLVMNIGPAVGASGAIFGLMGCIITFLYRYQRLFFVRDKRIGFVLLMWGSIQVAMGFLDPSIDNYAHIGGFLGGAACAMFVTPTLESDAVEGFRVLNPAPGRPVEITYQEPERATRITTSSSPSVEEDEARRV